MCFMTCCANLYIYTYLYSLHIEIVENDKDKKKTNKQTNKHNNSKQSEASLFKLWVDGEDLLRLHVCLYSLQMNEREVVLF